MSEITTFDWKDKKVIPLIVIDKENSKGIGFKIVVNSINEEQEGVIVKLNEEDFLSALEFFKKQCQK